MVSYLFISIILAVLGIAIVVTVTAIAVSRGRQRRELSRRQEEIRSEAELDDFIGRVDRALSAEDIDRLENERKDPG